MRAEMKLATGMVPVALGVAMALMSGMAKAEDNAAQSQLVPGAVSAKTTLPSVGHRPVITSATVFTDLSLTEDITSAYTNIKTGGQLFVNVNGVTDSDGDPFYTPLESSFFCSVYGLDSSGPDLLIAENVPCSKGVQGSIPITLSDTLKGKRIAVDIYAHSDAAAAQGNGYSPSPLKSRAYRITSANTAVDASPILFLRPAYAEVNGKRIEVDRNDINNVNDDIIHLPSAFAGAKVKVFLEGGTPTYKVNTTGNNTFSTVTNDIGNHSAEITIKDSIINSSDGVLNFSVLDGGGRPSGYIINFGIKVKEVFLSRPYKKNWGDAKTDCESDGYDFPYVGQGGHAGDPGNGKPGTLSHSTLFWGGYSKYSFPNASEYHWTKTESDSMNGIAFTLSQPNSIITGYGDKKSLFYFVCKKVLF